MTTIREQIQCVEREILFRKQVYHKWVRDGKMKAEKARYEIATMEDIKNSLLLMPKEASLIKL